MELLVEEGGVGVLPAGVGLPQWIPRWEGGKGLKPLTTTETVLGPVDLGPFRLGHREGGILNL